MSIIFVVPKNTKNDMIDLIDRVVKYKKWELVVRANVEQWEFNKVYLVEGLTNLRNCSFKNVSLIVNDADDYEYLFFYQPHILICYNDERLENDLSETDFLNSHTDSFLIN
jgi:hypothetical protein